MTIYIGLAFGFCIMLISASVLNVSDSVQWVVCRDLFA